MRFKEKRHDLVPLTCPSIVTTSVQEPKVKAVRLMLMPTVSPAEGYLEELRVREISRRLRGNRSSMMQFYTEKEEKGRGFGVMEAALELALQRAEPRQLDKKWEAVGAYLETFADHDSDEGLSERLYERLGNMADPEAISSVAQELLTEATTHRPGLRPIVRTVASALQEIVEYIEELLLQGDEADVLEGSVSPVVSPRGIGRALGHRNLLSHFAQSTRVIEACIRAYTTQDLRRVFCIWKGYVRNTKESSRVKQHQADLEKRLRDMKRVNTRLEARLDDLRIEVSSLRKEASTTVNNNKAAEEVPILQEANEKLNREVKSLQTYVERLEKQVEGQGEEIEQKKQDIQDAARVINKIAKEQSTGTGCEEQLQDHLVRVMEEIENSGYGEGSADDSADDEGDEVFGAKLIKLCANKLVEDMAEPYNVVLDHDEGFIRPVLEVRMIASLLRRVAPNIVSHRELEEVFEHEVLLDAGLVVVHMMHACCITTPISVEIFVTDDGRGMARHESLSFILQRILDERYERWFKSAELIWSTTPPPPSDPEEDTEELITIDSLYDEPFTPATERLSVTEEYGRYVAAKRRRAVLCFKRSLVTNDLICEMMLALGDPEADDMSPAEKRDVKMFTTVDAAAVQADIMKRYDDQVEVAPVMEELEQILLMNYRPLRRIFKYYANTEHVKRVEALTESKLSKAELAQLLSDCYTATDVQSYWNDSYGQGLSPEQFSWLLVKMSQKITLRAPQSSELQGADPFSMDTLEPIERVRVFIERVIIPNANHISLAAFKDAMHKNRMAAVLSEFKATLLRVFMYYASGKGTNDTNMQSAKEVKELSYKEFKQLMYDTKTYDEVCTQYSLQLTFTKMQDDYDLGVSYQEFTEIITAVAVFKSPAPYVPLETKVRQFLLEKFLPPLVKKCGLRIDALRDPFKARASNQQPTRPAPRRRRGTGRAVVVAAVQQLGKVQTNNASFKNKPGGLAVLAGQPGRVQSTLKR